MMGELRAALGLVAVAFGTVALLELLRHAQQRWAPDVEIKLRAALSELQYAKWVEDTVRHDVGKVIFAAMEAKGDFDHAGD